MASTRLEKLLDKEMTRKEFLRFNAIIFVSLFGVAGIVTEILSHADSSNFGIEPEKGTPTGTAHSIHDDTASGDSAIQFGPRSGLPRIIFDTDISSDYDDVGDIAVVNGLALLGECQVIGDMVSSTNGASATCMDAINTYYGTPDIPIGVRPDVGGGGAYPAQIASEFPHDLKSSADCMHAADLYRKLLAASPDASIIIVTAGYMDNVAALMKSGPDQYSSLNGIDLIKQKVKLLACAGGGYPDGGEFNFTVSPVAAQYAINNWPVAATFSPDNVGRYYLTGGTLVQMPTTNPIRRVYVDIEHNSTGYPSWTQVVIYQAIRGNSGLFTVNNIGHNSLEANGVNHWVASPDPSGAQEQAYIIERARVPITDGLNAIMSVLPASTASSLNVPGAPSDLKATVVNGSQINLSWLKNSYNETGFVIEKRTTGKNYAQIGTVGAGVTNFSATNLSSVSNVSFRVKAVNNAGSSYAYSFVWVYSGWTEYNFTSPGQGLPLYTYYQTSALRWAKGGAGTVDHVSINNDSTHGQNLTINVLTAAQGSEGGMFVYFFFTDKNNWYRLNFDNGGEVINDPNQWFCWFEKCVGGVITQIGAKAGCRPNSVGPWLAPWQIVVTAAGNITFTVAPGGNLTLPASGITQLLNVNDTLSFSGGKIGLGGKGMTPVWENFNFF